MNERLVAILHKSIDGASLSDVEKNELNEWLALSVYNQKLYDEVMNSENFRQDVKKMLSYDSSSLLKKINQQLYPLHHKNNLKSIFRSRPFWYAAAAVVFIVILGGIYLLPLKGTSASPDVMSKTGAATITDISPGREKATLTLDNGTELVLDKTSNGKIAEQGNTTIVKKDGQLSYSAGKTESSAKILYNTLNVPRAAYYSSLILADGSKVWLNSESSIRFPTAFIGKERLVEVTGEVYFEVAKNAAKPFRVSVKEKGVTIEVIGTHFNINAYNDESSVNTTLIEGAVRVLTNGKPGLLKPGEQASVNANGEINVTSDIDVSEVVAWKNGVFSFKRESLETIMRQVGRWYGVEVVFQDKIQGHFVATVPRDVPVSKLLKIFEATGGVKFEIDEASNKINVRR
jgi:transmembrane sensor